MGERSRLHELLRQRGMTQQRLADLLGVHKSQISQWSNGYRVMSYQYRKKVARILGVDIEALYESDTDDD